jgi:two-component system, OmpR family, phosphate regulon response regulator PhoB
MRSVVFRYRDIGALAGAIDGARGSLPLPEGESVSDGEWVLATFEIGSRRRATAAAARGVVTPDEARLAFERRDWDRLAQFVAARLEAATRNLTSSMRVPTAAPTCEPEAAPRSRRLDELPPSSGLESSRVPFGSRVLVIDDDGPDGESLRAMLAEMGLVVELAATARTAEQRMKTKPFDAIVVDLHAPGVDARAFVTKLRTDTTPIAEIPVLFLSSQPTSREAVAAFAIGADDFLPKPFRTPELAARIFGLLRRARLAAGGAPR